MIQGMLSYSSFAYSEQTVQLIPNQLSWMYDAHSQFLSFITVSNVTQNYGEGSVTLKAPSKRGPGGRSLMESSGF